MSKVIDSFIKKLLDVRRSCYDNSKLSEEEIRDVCLKSKQIFLSQPMLLELKAPLKICGDIHGQYSDLLRWFEIAESPSETNYLFLGDYVDRGSHSIQTICLLLAYKIKYPKTFFLLRGNHESDISRTYGFYEECKRSHKIGLWKAFIDCFDCLPVAAIVGDKIFCCHGGLSPDLISMEQIRQIKRPTDVPTRGLLCDLLWSDPANIAVKWRENTERGVSFLFGAEVVHKFLRKHQLDLICRAHQVVEDGYEFFADRKLVTLFSAPNYCNKFDNAGAIMSVDASLECSFQILKPSITKNLNKINTGVPPKAIFVKKSSGKK